MDHRGTERRLDFFGSPIEVEEVVEDRGSRLVRASLGLITIVNFLVPFAAGLWLAFHGERRAAAVGVGAAIALPLIWSWVGFRTTVVIAGCIAGHGRRPHPLIVAPVSFATAAWQYGLIAAWTLAVFLYFEDMTYVGNTLPMLAWGYGIVMCPLSYMASKDPGLDSAPVLALTFAFLCCAVIAACYRVNVEVRTAAMYLAGLTAVSAMATAAAAALAAAQLRRRLAGGDGGSGRDLGRDLHRALRGSGAGS